MKKVFFGGVLIFILFFNKVLTYGNTFFQKDIDFSQDVNSLYGEENVPLKVEEEKLIKDYALKYKDKITFLDLGANIDGFKEIGKDRYYQITLYSNSVKGNDLTGIVDRILINKKGNVLKGENGEPLSGIEGLITNLNISNNEILQLENLARKYEVKLNNKDLEVEVLGEKILNGKIYYNTNIYSKRLKKEGIYEPLEKLYISKAGEVIRNTEVKIRRV